MYDYIIVGGGISGLYMYYKLIESGKKIILLEKLHEFGGRIYQKKEKGVIVPGKSPTLYAKLKCRKEHNILVITTDFFEL